MATITVPTTSERIEELMRSPLPCPLADAEQASDGIEKRKDIPQK